ncbi:MAG: hypothetical protein HY288_09620 [Planctomycetia bacterium]|nr:hypothetical protein [Planctomycetia bacterium]
MAQLVQHTPAEDRPEGLGLEELDQAVRATDPAAFLVAPRILRRVIKQNAGVSGLGLRVPHRKTYVIAREKLLALVDRAELDLAADAELADNIILIARPTTETLAALSAEEALVKFWRQLFHIRIHVALNQVIAEGRLGESELHARIQQIGASEFEEIRDVLRQEDYLLPPKTDLTVYVEFVAVYLELRHFVPNFLRGYFPSLQDYHYIDELLKHDVDGESLLAATRPPGVSDPSWRGELPGGERLGLGSPRDEQPRRLPVRKRSQRTAAALLAKADRVGSLGNLVRAAILRTRAARYANPEVAHRAGDDARAELERLARRMQAALNFTSGETEEWTKSLVSLLDQSARGIWTAEARMLYDLQKVCVDHERGVYTLDAIGWATSLGRKPVKRFLPGQRDVLISKHLRGAARRLPAARLSNRNRSRLAALLQSAVHRAEASLRARFKPVIDHALDKVKLLPQNPPERVARKKLVDEILDRIVERGFLSMGDLRDALSRNNLKLPDLVSVKQFLLGDQLLQADTHLAASLDGVYRGGEIYLRWPQRLSSLAFGTPQGRFLTRYAALPFGGAYIALEGSLHLVLMVSHALGSDAELHLMPFELALSVLTLGLFLMGLLYHQRFRNFCLQGAIRAIQVCRRLFIDMPAWILRQPIVQAVVHSWQFQLFKRYVFKPAVVTVLAAPVIAVVFDREVTLGSSLVIFVVVNALLNSRIGRNVDEMVTDWAVLTWHRIRIHVFAAMFRLIMDVFNRILESIERLLYTVDEWLRFRAGERISSTVAKAVLGFFWFFVNYVIRFCVNLLIEPQVNPIKHFPVVTVSHKVLLPMMPALRSALAGPLGTAWAYTIAPTAVFLTPGIFGFLVWELKENWRLYAANRPADLRPVSIGHHGETMLQFLKPGFRSGTVPKLYAKLRRANRKAYWTLNWKAASKYLDGLHHASEALRRFVDRELLVLLHESRGWADRSITTGEIHLGCNRILVELYCPDLAEESMWLAFEEQAGRLVASVYRHGWSDALSHPRRHTLANALAGVYKMAGIDLVREQVEARLEPGSRGYEITEDSLAIWSGRDAPPRILPLRGWPPLEPADHRAGTEPNVTELDRRRWVFAATPISWRRWVVTWELDQLGGSSKHSVLEHMHLLPNA